MITITGALVKEGDDAEATTAEVEVHLDDEAPLDPETNKKVWPKDARTLSRIAQYLGWDAVREISCEESDDGLRRQYRVMRRYAWHLRFEVDATWVADGFSVDDERAHDILAHVLSHAYGHEFAARVLRAPDADAVAREMGYTGKDDPRLRESA